VSEHAQGTESIEDDFSDKPRRSALLFPVVGLGASAGGLATALRFFEHLPGNPGMAFVVVFHLSPEHESSAASILQRATRMPVLQVTHTVRIQADHVYVIAPALQLAMDDGHLRVTTLQRMPGRPMAVDLFFRTLARAHGERAIAVVLSGTGSDGSVGLADMKREGGVTIAQSPGDAEYDGMPSAAVATRLVDFVLPAAEIPGKLVDLWQNARQIELPSAKAIGLKAEEPEGARAVARAEAAVREIMATLHARTGNDFRHYKRATVLRRLERRMQVTSHPHLPAYRDYLLRHAEETPLLLQDMLISVTSFFRDREAFEALEREIMAALEKRPPPGVWRGWVVGCATGEEAYSLAILVNDHLPTGLTLPVQVFASDIDERALTTARHGVYPEAIVTDVPPTRLRQYFDLDRGAYRVKRVLREQITFSRHNVLRDPPFSRVDVICCRNLLIYLEREVQAQVLEVFHFALNPGGLLFLGSAETADWLPELFTAVDKKQRIYRSNPVQRPRADLLPLRPDAMPKVPPPTTPILADGIPMPINGRALDAPQAASVLVDRERHMLYVSGGASRYLRQFEGVPSQNLMQVIAPELAKALAPAMLKCLQTGQRIAARPVRLEGEQGPMVQMTVRPHGPAMAGTFAVVFDEVDATLAPGPGDPDPAVAVMEEEIRKLSEKVGGILGDSATSSEALRASNEELQSINEELRSATEELETSKEELQSVNEELTTVNFELKSKVEETAKANDDLSNLIVSMDIATVFVDRNLHIQRFTPRAGEIFNILATDVGRALLDITHRLRYDDLGADVEQVLKDLQTLEREIPGQGDRWFLARISPYRTGEDRIDGAVLNFIDVSERRRTEEKLRSNDERLRAVAGNSKDYAIMTLDAEGHVTSWNAGAELTFGYAESEMLGQHYGRLFVPEDQASGEPERELRHAREKGRALDERWHLRKDGSRFFCSGTTTPIVDGEAHGYAKIARDLTDRKLLEKQRDELLQAEKQVRQQLEAAHAMRSEFLAIMSHELKNPLNLILMNTELIARTPEGVASAKVGRAVDVIRRTVRAQSQIIDDLLDLSRLNTGKLALNRTAVQAAPLVKRITEAVSEELHAKSMKLSSRIHPLVVYADSVRLEQIVWNLVSNAVKFTPPGGQIFVRLVREGACARLQVSDTGQGIDAEAIDHVFGMFEQGGGAVSTRRGGGLGIGLALVKQLAELHDGRVEVQSEGRDKGATFSVWLPLFEGRFGGATQRSGATLYAQRVLLVEDDAETLGALRDILSTEGAIVTVASSGQEALEKSDAGAFDLVISDIAMPGMDGLQLIAELRRRPRSSLWPAIAVTGFGRPGDAERAKAAGFDDHLAKPLSIDALHESFSRLVRKPSQ
jgi:two-component system CheB/CheR fusion protein